ncbi:MAG: helix-turn-helix domain-containing protein [Bacteroidota bacterium]|nr:helix-turn-helix domain-containing protein [Bacteroidota bacterium]
MENPFEVINEKLESIEKQLTEMRKALQGTPPEKVNQEEILSIEEVSKLLSMTKSHIYKMTSTRQIPHYHRGKKLFFKRSEIEGWAFECRIKTMSEIEMEASAYIIRKDKGRR